MKAWLEKKRKALKASGHIGAGTLAPGITFRAVWMKHNRFWKGPHWRAKWVKKEGHAQLSHFTIDMGHVRLFIWFQAFWRPTYR